MHVILISTKNIYGYLLGLFSQREEMEEEKTKGHTTYQFWENIVEARNNARKYSNYLKAKFKDDIDTVEKKRAKITNLLQEIENVRSRTSTINFEKQQNKLF